MTRILFFATHFYPYIGGLENYLLELASRLVKRGVKVDVLTYNVHNIQEYEKYNGIGIYRIPSYDIMKDVYSLPKFNKDTRRILKFLSNNNYDFVITQTRFFSTSWLGMRFAKRNKIKFIHTEHGNVHVKHDNKIVESLAWLYDMTIGKKIFKSALRVVGISKACCNFAIRMGADPKKVYLIHNSIDTDIFKPTKSDVRKKMKINKDTFVISYAGRLIYAKGIQDMIKAVKDIENIKLLIMGKGPYLEDLKTLSQDLKVDTVFLGETKPDDVLKNLNASDLFVNPSFSEGLPTSVLEAGACGIPVIATDVGGTSEIIDDNENGFLITPQDVKSLKENILKLKEDNLLRDMFGKRIREKIKNEFDCERNIDKYVDELLKE